jgi:hypothetical protein
MDQLEQYLDRVCRGIGGPRALRQHVRRELREHLLDAMAEHKAAGLPEDQALARALEDFGGPDEVRSELEAAHGHRLMAVVIDKALDWKEKTMRAKWLWATWAHATVIAVIALEILWITFAEMFLVPKFYRVGQDGLLTAQMMADPAVAWMVSFLHRLDWVGDHLVTWLLLLSVAAWAAFEWRVRTDNKALIRLSALGTAAAALAVVGILTAGSMLVTLFLGIPGLLARPPV